MQFALREMNRFRTPIIVWLVVSAVAAVAGPFGTHDAMQIEARALYWGGIAALSIALNFGAIYLARNAGF
jgi:hypothetical protein